jgi:uncharacterized protein YyaL (SSP411 family)
MVAALAHASRVFDRPEWLACRCHAFKFVLERYGNRGASQSIPSAAGQAKAPATASDYANMIWGALRLLQATNEPAFLTVAERWVRRPRQTLLDGRRRRLRLHRRRHPDVIVRMRGAHDDATPNANAIQLSNLVALHLLTGKQAYLDRANAIPQASPPTSAATRSATAACWPAPST